jgi:hypothetical protein
MRSPSWLMSSTTPLTDQELGPRQAPGRNGRSCSAGRDLAIFLISRRWASVHFGGRPPLPGYSETNSSTLKLRITSRIRSSLVKATFAIAATSIALRRQQHHLRPSPGHHRPTAAPYDPHQSSALIIIINLTHPQAFCHPASLENQRHQRELPGQDRPQGKRDLLWH